jgi:hypothetical protein
MKRILLSTAAVLASVTLAGAQSGSQQPNEKQSPAAASERAQPKVGGQGKGDQQPQRDSQPVEREKGAQQAPRGDRKDSAPGTAERQKGDDAKRDAQQKARDEDGKKADTKRDAQQKPRDGDAQKADTQRDQDRAGQGQREPQRAQDQREPRDRDQRQDTNRQQGPTQQKPTAQQQDSGRQDRVQADAQGRVTLNTEQRTRIQQTVFARSDVPRVSRVDFSVTVGTAVPSHVTIVEVPPTLIELNPEWRGHRYFVVDEEIVIVTPERKIVAVVPVGRSHAGGSSGGGGVVVELPEAEVRILQQVLVERGFAVEVDGVWGPRTREALISFQRKEGLQPTGQIDTRTVTSLGVQGRVNVQTESETSAGQETKTGGQQQPTAQPPNSQQPAQQQGNQRSTDENQKTTGSGDRQQDGQSQPPMRGSESGRQPERQRSGAPAGREPPSQPDQRPSGQKQ